VVQILRRNTDGSSGTHSLRQLHTLHGADINFFIYLSFSPNHEADGSTHSVEALKRH
jgi:hypothetical protein